MGREHPWELRRALNDKKEQGFAGLFGQVWGVACDGAHVYVTDHQACRVVKLSLDDGTVVGKAGGSGHELGKFDLPYGIALAGGIAGGGPSSVGGCGDGSGGELTLFVSDQKNHRVVALDPADLSVRFAFGSWGFGDGQFREPSALCAHGGLLAVADRGNRRVQLFDLGGRHVRSVGQGDGPGCLQEPPGMVAMGDGHLFVVEEKAKREEHEAERAPGARARHETCRKGMVQVRRDRDVRSISARFADDGGHFSAAGLQPGDGRVGRDARAAVRAPLLRPLLDFALRPAPRAAHPGPVASRATPCPPPPPPGLVRGRHNTNSRGDGMINGMACFDGGLFLASGASRILSLRDR